MLWAADGELGSDLSAGVRAQVRFERHRWLADQQPTPPPLQEALVQSLVELDNRVGASAVRAVGSYAPAYIATARPGVQSECSRCREKGSANHKGHQQP